MLHAQADEVRRRLAGIDGVERRPGAAATEPTIEIEVDLAARRRLGIKPGDVRRAAATLLSGIQVGNLFEDQKVFEVVMWGAPEIREQPVRHPETC